MKLPLIRGVIDRRILANYRVAPDRLALLLPPPLRPKVFAGFGVAGICLIRLTEIRPRGLPRALGTRSENAAHRVAVEWDDPATGEVRQGVYIPRRDTSSRLNAWAGGRVFTGLHRHAKFDVHESAGRLHVALVSDDAQTRVRVDATVADRLPEGSIFGDLPTASEFFRGGSLGFSASADPARLDGLELRTDQWRVKPLAVERVESSFFDDAERFPPGSIAFDCALIMRGVEHEWHVRESMCVGCAAVGS
jgi:hypothetical protein